MHENLNKLFELAKLFDVLWFLNKSEIVGLIIACMQSLCDPTKLLLDQNQRNQTGIVELSFGDLYA